MCVEKDHLSISWQRTAPDASKAHLVLRWGDLEFRVALTPLLDGTKAG